jgi:RNA polymerase sigma-70 factor (ECF subfamily)
VSHSQLIETRDEDAALVLRVGEGDVGAYRELVARYAPQLLGFATRVLRDPAEAEDVVQETCLRLWQHAREYTPRARVTTWLHRITHNLAVDRLRARGRLKPLPDEDEDAMPESARQPSLIDEKRRLLALDAALAELPERQAAALTLVHLHGLSGKEAAEVLGVGAEALESLLARARRALKAGLTEPRAAGAKGAS